MHQPTFCVASFYGTGVYLKIDWLQSPVLKTKLFSETCKAEPEARSLAKGVKNVSVTERPSSDQTLRAGYQFCL
jgi:hypothetical protein